MRLPYLQVDGDFITQKARTVAVLLGCSHPQAIGHLSLLWAWALSQGPEEEAPTGLISGQNAARLVRAAAGWEGNAEDFIAVLTDPGVGLLERLPDGFRVRGMERYRKAWDKQRKDRARKADVRRNSSGHPSDGASQTQTQTQKEASASQASAAASPPILAVQEAAPEKPKRAPNTTALGEFIDWARAEVKPRLPADAVDPAAGLKPHERVRLGEAVKDHGLEAVKAAFRLFMGWQPAQSKGYSVGFFANQWEGWVRQAKAPVAPVAATTPKGSPDDERARALRAAVAASRVAKSAGGAS